MLYIQRLDDGLGFSVQEDNPALAKMGQLMLCQYGNAFVQVTFTDSTTPSVFDLSGTVFTITDAPAIVPIVSAVVTLTAPPANTTAEQSADILGSLLSTQATNEGGQLSQQAVDQRRAGVVARHQGLQPGKAEHLPPRVVRLDQAVAVEQHRLAR